jgi:hypothetical protein
MDKLTIAKETRDLVPFLDPLVFTDAASADQADAVVQAVRMPTLQSPSSVRADTDMPGFLNAKIGPLPDPFVPATDGHEQTSIDLMGQHGGADGRISAAAATRTPSDHDGGGMSLKASFEGAAAQKYTPADHAGDNHVPDLDVQVVQDVDVQQSIDVDILIKGGATVDVTATSDVIVDQSAEIDIDIADDIAQTKPSDDAGKDGALVRDGVDEFRIDNDQDIDVVTTITVDVRGYGGDVFIETNTSDSADIDQNARSLVRLDGNDATLDIDISQFLDIDLLSDIEIDIREDDGQLFIMVSVDDKVSGDDDVSIALSDDHDDVMELKMAQSVEVDHRLGIDVDVEQQLAALFDIEVDVDAEADIDVRQSGRADIDISRDGETDIDFDGDSEVQISNHLNIRIDFSVA